MSVFASYFWLWSIIGLLGLILLYTLGALMNLAGFVTPIRRATAWIDDSPTLMKGGIVAALFGLLAYPSIIHRLWADATAQEIRRAFDSLPVFPEAFSGGVTEQMSGLYDPTGTDSTYIIGWYGSTVSFSTVQTHYEQALGRLGWVEEPERRLRPGGAATTSRAQFRDHADIQKAHYQLLLMPLATGSREVPAQIAEKPTVYAVRLGVVDPRATTQVAWFIDCLVHRAPTFPTCEAAGWSALDPAALPRP